jgi:hypothetical protein
MSNFLGNMHTFMHMYMHDKNLIKTKLILLKHVEQLLLLIKHNVDTTWVQLRPLKRQTLWQLQTFGFVNGIESDVSQNVTQTLSTLISFAMALILTPSLSLTHFCQSDNCGIPKVTRDSDLICQKLTLTL